MSAPSRKLRARIANLSQYRLPTDPELNELRRDLSVERCIETIHAVLAGQPAPTPAQIERMAAVIADAASKPARKAGAR